MTCLKSASIEFPLARYYEGKILFSKGKNGLLTMYALTKTNKKQMSIKELRDRQKREETYR